MIVYLDTYLGEYVLATSCFNIGEACVVFDKNLEEMKLM